jgi:hypothetical protein
MRYHSLFITTLLILLPVIVQAAPEQVVIQDTSGVMRAMGEGGDIPVEFQAIDDATGLPANGTEVRLKNVKDPSETLSKVFVNGTAVFDTVPAGTWEVAANGVTFQDVAIGASHAFAGAGVAAAGSAGGLSGSTLAAGGLVAAGGTAAVAANNSRGSSNKNGSGNGSSIFPENPEELSPSR